MMRRLALILAALLCASVAHASVAIGTPVQLGAGTSTASSATLQITTSADSPSGAAIFVATGITVSTTAIQTVADDAGNTYTPGTGYAAAGGSRVRLFWCFYCRALPSGSHITVTYGATTLNPKLGAAISVTGINNLDLDGAGAGATSTTPSITSGTLGQPSEIIIGLITINVGGSDSFTEASGFNSNTSTMAGGGALRWAYKIVNATTSVAYAPALGTLRTWNMNYDTFEARNCTLATLGVGVC